MEHACELAEKKKKYYLENLDTIREYKKKYREENRDRLIHEEENTIN
jgi:hypothetical protein